MFTEKAISSELGQGRSKRIISTSNISVIQKSCFEFKVPQEVLNGPFFQITFPQVALLARNQKRNVGWVEMDTQWDFYKKACVYLAVFGSNCTLTLISLVWFAELTSNGANIHNFYPKRIFL